jgi:hypothetical protein
MKLLMENWNRFLNEEADPADVKEPYFPKDLSDVHPTRARYMSRTGGKDGESDDDVINVSHKPQGVAPVQKLKPSQSSMNIPKAMAFVVNMLSPKNKLSPGGDLGAFISNDGYIMDGHHRWVATAMIDPSMSMGGYLVDFPGQQLVAVLNAMTKGLFGVQRGKAGKGGFHEFTPEKMKEQLVKYAKGGVWDLQPEDVMEVLQKWTGQEGEAAIDAAVSKMSQNIGTLTFETPAWASDRPEMPVIDDNNVGVAANAMKSGQINVSPPYRSGEADEEFKQSQPQFAGKGKMG